MKKEGIESKLSRISMNSTKIKINKQQNEENKAETN